MGELTPLPSSSHPDWQHGRNPGACLDVAPWSLEQDSTAVYHLPRHLGDAFSELGVPGPCAIHLGKPHRISIRNLESKCRGPGRGQATGLHTDTSKPQQLLEVGQETYGGGRWEGLREAEEGQASGPSPHPPPTPRTEQEPEQLPFSLFIPGTMGAPLFLIRINFKNNHSGPLPTCFFFFFFFNVPHLR